MNQQFIGEHLLPGKLGQFFIILTFIGALYSAFCYWYATKKEVTDFNQSQSLMRWARNSFILHLVGIVGAFIVLYFIISNHYFEYHYAWRHSSMGLKTKYLLACFWEGSEGSFMLWILWQAILGVIILLRKDPLESRVMTIIALVQALLTTLILGIYLGPDLKIGSTPFTLLRDEMAQNSLFTNPNYLQFIEDGNGLNVLLQNYWMVIHPPILFLGFALTLIPFAYSVAAIWKGDYKLWLKPALNWALAGGAIFGAGIMMGGAWAYESLNFGGYWAWDPVENASLVPWLISIAGIHTLLIFKSTGRSLKITLVFFMLTFLFVWYSTFLTRTGVLGDTSVHAFTDSGKALYYHLIITIAVFVSMSLYFMIRGWKKLPVIAGEEETNSREFWMLIGSIFLLIASVQIIFYTSLPVWAPLWKLITNSDIAPPPDPVEFYNNIQVWFAFIVAMLSAVIQFLKYKKTNLGGFWKITGLIAVASLILAATLVWQHKIEHIQYMFFAFAVIFALLSNVWYIFTVQKGKWKRAGGAITHLGFALMLLGILFSGYNKEVVSLNRTGEVSDFGKATFEENAKESRENVLLFRNTSLPMGDYLVTYLGDSVVSNDPPITYFKVKFEKRDLVTNEVKESFMLYPNSFVNAKGQEGLSSNPDAKHYFTHDLFVYVNSVPNPDAKADTTSFKPYTIKLNDTIYMANGFVIYKGISNEISNKQYVAEAGDVAAQLEVEAYSIDGKLGTLNPVYYIRNQQSNSTKEFLTSLGLEMTFNKINPETETIEIGIKQRAQQDDWIVLKALNFPYINLLWLGIIVMIIGFFISLAFRRRESKSFSKKC